MNDEQTLRIILVALFVAVLPIGLYHRIKSQATGESLDRRQEGLFILATLRPLGAAFWLGMIAWMINPSWMAWSAFLLPIWWRWVGLVLVIAGGALLVWTVRSLGKNLTDTVVTRQKHTLVVHGPYRWIRHPLYSAATVLTVGISVITANWFLFLVGALVVTVLVIRTSIEERNLIARFGGEYRGYMARTGRFVPKL